MVWIKQIFRSEKGSVLALVFIWFLILTTLGTSFLALAAFEGQHAVQQEQRALAFWRAEGGLNLALWRINHGSDTYATFSNDEVSVVYDSTALILSSTGVAGSAQCRLDVELYIDNPFNHILSYCTSIDVQGDLVISYCEGKGLSQYDNLPTVDLNYYYHIADYYYYGDQSFSDTLPDGIHFIDGKVEMKNGTSLNGTLIVTKGVTFKYGVTINAQLIPGTDIYYPAVICADTVQTEVDITGHSNLNIIGMVYSTGKVSFKNGSFLTGPIIANIVESQGDVEINDSGQTIYYHCPPGFSPYVDQDNNQKRVVRGSWQRN
ncbi:MAG: hypothetical protein WCS36_01390 [Candidatus Neomarinimicrobiota bacterium]